MLRKKLRVLVLNQLAEGPRSGYSLIKDIEAATGWKPSYGSIYPLLEHLHEEKLVTFKEVGRKKVYSLTKEGKGEQKAFLQRHDEVAEKFKEMHCVMSSMMGLSPEESQAMTQSFLGAVEAEDPSFKAMMKPSMEIKKEFFRIYNAGLMKKRKKEVKTILDDAVKKLKKIR